MKSAEKSISIKDNPLASTLRTQIKNRIEAMDTNVRALERKAGLNVGTINNILNGASANPTAETLNAIANTFDCSIDSLLGRADPQSSTDTRPIAESFQGFTWNSHLFSSIVVALNKQLEDKNLSISSEKALSIIHEVYLYSLKKHKEEADESLIEWLLDKSI
jgi:transcriptional regulator with XRE-family HTH domain